MGNKVRRTSPLLGRQTDLLHSVLVDPKGRVFSVVRFWLLLILIPLLVGHSHGSDGTRISERARCIISSFKAREVGFVRHEFSLGFFRQSSIYRNLATFREPGYNSSLSVESAVMAIKNGHWSMIERVFAYITQRRLSTCIDVPINTFFRLPSDPLSLGDLGYQIRRAIHRGKEDGKHYHNCEAL
jgi:hypothetical protein